VASLTAPHWEAALPGARELLEDLARLPLLRPFYLGGGTALALQLGHRLSRDFDLFAALDSFDDDLRRDITHAVQQNHIARVLSDSPFELVLEIDGKPTSFLTYGYPLLDVVDLPNGFRAAGLLDIGLMKLDAVMGRGLRKDFYDLYFLARRVTLDELFARSADKYPTSPTFKMRALSALVDFDIADQQTDPTLLLPVRWDDVRAFFVSEVRRLGQQWIESDSAGQAP
jgi:hypothetical protein